MQPVYIFLKTRLKSGPPKSVHVKIQKIIKDWDIYEYRKSKTEKNMYI